MAPEAHSKAELFGTPCVGCVFTAKVIIDWGIYNVTLYVHGTEPERLRLLGCVCVCVRRGGTSKTRNACLVENSRKPITA